MAQTPEGQKRFEEARARLHEARRAEAVLGFNLMVEFIKMRQGDCSSAEIEGLFHQWGMPYGHSGASYLAAREKAGVPLKKKQISRLTNKKARHTKLLLDFKELLDTTPDHLKPKMVESIHGENITQARVDNVAGNSTPGKPTLPALVEPDPPRLVQVGKWNDLSQVDTEALIIELRRREEAALALLRTLGKLPTPSSQPE